MDLKDRVEQISATIADLRQAGASGAQALQGPEGHGPEDQGLETQGPETRRLLDSLFRAVHSFKAAAAAAGFAEQSRTAHEFENLLHNLRTGKLTLNAEVLRVCDEAAISLLGQSVRSPLKDLNLPATPDKSDNPDLPPAFSTLKPEEQHRAIAAKREGANLYVLDTTFNITDFDERFRQLQQQLDQTAELISASPTMDGDTVNFRIFYAAKFEKIPAQKIFEKALLAGKATARTLDKHVEFRIMAEELLLDRSLCDPLENALLHLVRNAVDHGIEKSGRVTIQLLRVPKVRILVTDNGRGIDPANLPLLFQPGFSTAAQVSETSGRGVGLDVVKTEIEAIGGTVNVISVPDKFTSFVITLPNPSSGA